MRSLLIASVALLGLSATAAYAGEGNGDPFPGPNAALTTRPSSHPYVNKDQDPYQFRVAGLTTQLVGVKLSIDHSQDPFQYRVAGVHVGGSDNSALASRDQAPTATNAKTEAATPHG
jgi:hypothetical protein